MPNDNDTTETDTKCPHCSGDHQGHTHRCPECHRTGCPECMPGGDDVQCPECEAVELLLASCVHPHALRIATPLGAACTNCGVDL